MMIPSSSWQCRFARHGGGGGVVRCFCLLLLWSLLTQHNTVTTAKTSSTYVRRRPRELLQNNVGGVTGLVVVNADTNQDMFSLVDNVEINLAVTPHITIRADVTGQVASVIFGLDANPNFKTEGKSPYTLAGDNGDCCYNPLVPPLSIGNHVLTATAKDNAGDTVGQVATVSFQVVEVHAPYSDSLGRWGPVFDMGVIAIHVMLLDEGKVLSYGANQDGVQGGDRVYEIWDASAGDHDQSEHHVVKTQNSNANIFCSTLSVDITTGNVLIMGGDDGTNLGIDNVLELNGNTHEIYDHPLGNMKYPRWYGTSVSLPDGRIFIAGGKSGVDHLVASSIPEIWDPQNGFRALPGAEVPAMNKIVTAQRAWWYPHVFINSQGDIVMIISDWKDYDVYRVGDVDGNGSIQKVTSRPFRSDKLGPSILHDVDQVVMLDDTGTLWSVDICNSYNPVFYKKASLGTNRMNAAMAMLPDGRVIINGGSDESGDTSGTNLTLAIQEVQIWDPVTDTIYNGPKQDVARLYHSSSLILADGSVFSAGGGAPGPLNNSNGQIYYPGYFFETNTGVLATRPVIQSWPANIQAGATFLIQVDNSAAIQRVTATKSGSMTHARNCDARWLGLSFSILDATNIEISTPGRTIMIPGLWNLNVIDNKGVPSPARLVRVNMASATLGGRA